MWRDTVITSKDLIRLDDTRETNTDIEASLWKQAEISWKLATKEVVDFFEGWDILVGLKRGKLQDFKVAYQAKRKEWGYEDKT